jgi:two-component system LytT family response regulator
MIYRESRTTYIVTQEESYSTSESLSSLLGKLSNINFFKSHRAYILNTRYIAKIYPYGRWTYVVKMKNTNKDALITKDKLKELEDMVVSGS